MRLYLMLSMLVLVPILGSVHAYAQVGEDDPGDGHDHEELPPVEGTYVSRDGLTEIGFPSGWSGFEVDHGSAVVAMTTKGAAGLSAEPDFAVPTIMLIVSEEKVASMQDLVAAASENRVECTVSESQQAWINGAIGTAFEATCAADGERLQIKSLLVETTAGLVMAAYISPEATYEDSMAEFNEALRSFKIFNAADSSLQSLNSSYYDINAANTAVTLEVLSSSSVAGFALDEGNRQVLLLVEERGSAPGVVIVPAGIVLEGPYSVSVDGEAVDVDEPGVLLRSEPTGDQMIKVGYPPGQHEVSITGVRVVPEFSMLTAVAASMMALVLVIGLVVHKLSRAPA